MPTQAPWWEAFANAQTVPIDQVPLVTDLNGFASGSLNAGSTCAGPPWFGFYQSSSTVTAIAPDHAHDILWIAVTSSDKGLTRVHYTNATFKCMISGPYFGQSVTLTYVDRIDGGATLWWAITEHTSFTPSVTSQSGLQNLVGKLRVGMMLPFISSGFGVGVGHGVTSTEVAANLASWTRLKQSVGHAYPRSDRRFSFYAFALTPPPDAPGPSPSL
jgi:hypothetical protein